MSLLETFRPSNTTKIFLNHSIVEFKNHFYSNDIELHANSTIIENSYFNDFDDFKNLFDFTILKVCTCIITFLTLSFSNCQQILLIQVIHRYNKTWLT